MVSRISVSYRIQGDHPREVAEAISVEQSIEFPKGLAPEWIQREVVGSIDQVSPTKDGMTDVTISYDVRNAGAELPQLINMLWGNVSMFRGVRIIGIGLPDEFLAGFKGPRFGLDGLRTMFDAPKRALVSTALKPMGSSSREFAAMAKTIALAGFDTIKDDHSLANQPWSLWRERVEMVSEAVREANETTGRNCVYAPSLNLPAEQIHDSAHVAKSLGAGALLVLPGISGWDIMRVLAEDGELALPIMGHLSALGVLVNSDQSGVSHDVIFGIMMRLCGADISIFPNFGGRLAFTSEECLSIAESARNPLGNLKPLWVSPAAGLSLDMIPGMLDFYGIDLAVLVGGALHRGSLADNSASMVKAILDYSSDE